MYTGPRMPVSGPKISDFGGKTPKFVFFFWFTIIRVGY
jgi:hypothetical protein